MKKKVLIIGNSAKEYALARKLAKTCDVFVTPKSDTTEEFATCLDIREDSVSEILEFVLENGIDMTIPVSHRALNTNIADIFTSHNLPIFAPNSQAYKSIFDKAGVKKLLYKLRIPTPKFGIFEKQNMVNDYIKNLKSPFVIKNNSPNSAIVFTSPQSAKNIIDSLFAEKNQKLIIEDYIWGTPFSFYTVTDGYKAIPVGSSITYKHSLEGDGGQLTSGMGACVPNYKLSIDNECFLMNNVIYPILDYLEANKTPYLGILGINGVLSEDGNIQILGFQSFMQDCDTSAVLELIDTDLFTLLESCTLGTFSDEVEFIPQKEASATALVLQCKNKENNNNTISGLELLDESTKIDFFNTVHKNKYLEFEANSGSVVVLTSFARTTTSSTQKVYEEAECIEFKGLHYRKDICKPQRTTI